MVLKRFSLLLLCAVVRLCLGGGQTVGLSRMAVVLVLGSKNFPLQEVGKQLDALAYRYNFLWGGLREVPSTADWGDSTIAALDVHTLRVGDQQFIIDHLIVDLLEQLPELFSYAFYEELEAKEIEQSHLATTYFKLALPF